MLQHLKNLLQNYIAPLKVGAQKKNESSLVVTSTEAALQTTLSPDDPASITSELENEDNSKSTTSKNIYTCTYISLICFYNRLVV